MTWAASEKEYPDDRDLRYMVAQLHKKAGEVEEATSLFDQMIAADPKDGIVVEITKYPDGPAGVKTEYYLVKNGGHNWPGRPLYLPESVIGKASQAFSASDVIWKFFASCPPRTPQQK